MRLTLATTIATLAIAGTALVNVAPAFAGADDGGTKAFWLPAETTSAAPAQPTTRAREYQAVYQTPRQEAAAPAATVEKDPPAFYHAMGTMSTP